MTLFNADERKGLWGEVLGVTVGSTEVNFPRERAEAGKIYAQVELLYVRHDGGRLCV